MVYKKDKKKSAIIGQEVQSINGVNSTNHSINPNKTCDDLNFIA